MVTSNYGHRQRQSIESIHHRLEERAYEGILMGPVAYTIYDGTLLVEQHHTTRSFINKSTKRFYHRIIIK